jgi:hypothetical protein
MEHDGLNGIQFRAAATLIVSISSEYDHVKKKM